MRTALFVVCAICLLPLKIVAGDYKEIVSSYDNDFYKIDSKTILIRTENCLEDVQSQEVLITMNGHTGEIAFSESENRCAVAAVLDPAAIGLEITGLKSQERRKTGITFRARTSL